ncbi:glucose dehydrogenase [FAD, quinone]-like [Pararge aegeria]|uniref:glucose dehydrogenase [FAD, quinone]-like n=1 Tax=Pararge aegeria TaxID=116150 RepID=UPI0019CF670F|nr:glucose dehydrogenase [FAD, quinone]-like [Pararge aegeria]
MDVASSLAVVQAVKGALVVLAALGLTAYKWSTDTVVTDDAVYDYIVVGAGTAGSIVANRLTENPDVHVLLVESGGDPPFETEVPGMFPFLTKSAIDWNYVSEDDGYSAQYHRNGYLDLPSGKVYGGSSSIHHFYYVRGHANDYKAWVDAAADDSWSWENLIPYFKKSECLVDQDILNSPTGQYHGTNGYTVITRELREISLKYLEAFQEVGNKVVDDINTGYTLGFTRPMVFIGNGIRQSSAESFLLPIKHRLNLHLTKETTVDKILFDNKKNAMGVQVSRNGKTFNIYARKEVIVSAGAFNSPKLLMLSGVGPKAHLESMGIEIVADLPVGESMEDHLAVVLAHKLKKTDETPKPENPSDFPIPTFIGLDALDTDQGYPDYLTLNLICRNNPTNLLLLCATVFGLHNDVCEQLAKAGQGREILVTVLNVARPISRGKVLLRSKDPKDPPRIYTGFLSNSTDLENNAAYIEKFIKVTDSSYFRNIGGETLHFDLPNCKGLEKNTRDYWKCYVLNMMDTTFHYSSTCRMGSVLDGELKVLGVNKLRVVDASSMPNTVSANINAAVMVLAEKAADLIKKESDQYNVGHCVT